MAPGSRYIWAMGCALAFALLLCPAYTFRRITAEQTDEDLTFDDEDAFLARSKREVDEHDSSSGLMKRQSFGLSSPFGDDNDFITEGSGYNVGSAVDSGLRTYRVKFLRDEFYSVKLADRRSKEFNDLKQSTENGFRPLFKNVEGSVDVHVVKIGTGKDLNQQEVMMDLTHVGVPYRDDGAKIQRILESAIASRLMNAVPQSLAFNEVQDRSDSRCKANEELCPEGTCVPRCDGIAQCVGGADERNCGLIPDGFDQDTIVINEPDTIDVPFDPDFKETCSPDHSLCDTNRCVENIKWCDGVSDCRDNSDEKNCAGYVNITTLPPTVTSSFVSITTNPTRPDCSPEDLPCDDKCIRTDQLCDNVRDCLDGLDESPDFCGISTCSPSEFRCNDGTCIAAFRRCDFAQDCPGNEDEENCMCEPPRYQCISGQCIDGDLRCNGFEDCEDGTDEDVGCVNPCDGSGQYNCDDGDTCLDDSQLCDGRRDCLDGSDEGDCGTYPPYPSSPSTSTTTTTTTTTPSPNTTPEGDRLCPQGLFQCDEGRCMSIDLKCDGKIDCQDRSDESDCSCNHGEWQCGDGSCIASSSRCDRIQHCSDGSDEIQCPGQECKEDEFRCQSDGFCIPKYLVCDHQPYCRDGSDELNCPSTAPPSPSSCSPPENFLCQTGICIKGGKRCNGITDCQDGSDEANCPSTGCPHDQFRCDDGKCLNIDQVCNGLNDCTNGEDERTCSSASTCSPNEFRCSNGYCIPISLRCDGKADCFGDDSDESNCPPVPTTPPSTLCTGDKFQCTNGQCIPDRFICDGFSDCNDGSDENEDACGNLGSGKCTDSQFTCNSGECIDAAKRCDERFDCFDQSDENACPPARSCTEDEFVCTDKTCIPKQWRCDDSPDCADGKDEENCVCGLNEFRCGDDKCIPESTRCDGRYDCNDGSDEQLCPCSSVDEFTCRNGECIDINAYCDRKFDCLDRSDEENCDDDGVTIPLFNVPSNGSQCGPYQFQCQNSQCIEQIDRCNGIYNCRDLSDETDCPTAECGPGEYQCDNGDCIDKNLVCDNDYDCADASDELDCDTDTPVTICETYEFECLSGECISQAVVCDGRIDCYDYSDEEDCENKTARACNEDQEFTCEDGTCINLYARCDQRYDCRDRSDEADCQSFLDCTSSQFRCDDGQCVPRLFFCDGSVDCLDGSDERECEKPPPSCDPYQFRCSSGECVSVSFRCNGINDCNDKSDEINCPTTPPPPSTPPPRENCGPQQFTCRNGQCINRYRVCDKTFHCLDRSDEENCPDDNFICDNGQTIPDNRRCDGRRDCLDGSDEIRCPGSCSGGEFQCLSDGNCISESLKCDGSYDCLDRSDEADCVTPPQPSDSLDLKTYPEDQTIKQNREVVFQCRDEGPRRNPVRWVRGSGQRLPSGSTDNRGRLTMPNIQVEHSGSYFCEAQGVPASTPGSRKSVTLRVVPFELPSVSPTPDCTPSETTCSSGECIPKSAVCDSHIDCSDGSDEDRCASFDCEPNQFRCDNSRCVYKAYVCDAEDDCGDNSDERTCIETSPPGSDCTNFEFECQAGDQCIPKAFNCDGETDCQDGSDEFGCSIPTILEPPPRELSVDIGETFTISCKVVGIPIPIVTWRLNWGHVPASCSMVSNDGYGVLTCTSAQAHHQGAYSCEAINIFGSSFAQPDTIVHVKTTDTVCPPPKFNANAITSQDCLGCFCFGITDQCFSTGRSVSQLPPPMSDSFSIIGVNQVLSQGNYAIRDRDYPLSSRYLRTYSSSDSVQLEVADRNRLAGPSDLLLYFSLPDSHKGYQLTAYGGFVRYNVQFRAARFGQVVLGPDVILRGNNITIMHVHEYRFEPARPNQIDVRFWPGSWYKRVINRGVTVQSQEPASRHDILTVLENIDLFLIRASYTDENFIDTTLSNVQLDTTVIQQTNQGRAVYVEECRCPTGYTGLSCETCAPNYRRTFDGPHLGRCVSDRSCGPNEYGDPENGIPCLACPCPLTNPANQFSQSCYLDSDGQITCNCRDEYQGRRCDVCAEGYEGNPSVPGESCQPAGECDSKGSLSLQPNPATGMCECKDYTTGPKCSQCQNGSFYLHENNQYGCIKCFCMGITDSCTSSNLYRSEEVISFISNTHGMQLVDKYQRNIIKNNMFTDTGRQELVFRTFSELPREIYYWKLPQRFLGDKVTAYGGNLTFTLRYMPAPGGQSSRNNAYNVEIYGNDVTLRHFSKQVLNPSTLETISVPFYEQYWQRQDGQTSNREHFLMALADLEYILIKATYTTNTQEVGLKEVRMASADQRNTGQERADAVEMCDCPLGYRGLSCEDCDVGYTRGLSGIHLGTCIPCNCNGFSDYCDPETGACKNCRENKDGDYCELCADGYHENSIGQCERVDPCTCDPRGSVSSQCYDNRCQCRANVEGDECNTCKEGHFFLSEKNEQGCLACWCHGVTNRCSSSQYYREEIPMNLFKDHGFTLADRYRTNVIRDNLEVDIQDNKISYNRFNQLSPQTTYYWSLPPIFTGNILTSYGGKLRITQSFDSQSTSDIYYDADVIITSSDKREFIWMNKNPLTPRRLHNYTVDLVESQFTVEQRPATRGEFLAALASVEAILIRAEFSESMLTSGLQYVTMDTAVDYRTGKPRALEVEDCSCPSEYRGFSCEECAKGYYRDPRNNRCLRCPCNGKEESCFMERNRNVVCVCLSGYTGANCLSVDPDPRIPGDLEVTTTQEVYEAEVGSTIRLICNASPSSGISIIWDREGAPLQYGRASDDRQGTLIISQVQPEDAGPYICRASTGVYVNEVRTELFVTDVPTIRPTVIIEERREEVEISIGQYFEVRCRASGSPVPQVQWLRADGRPLSPTVNQRSGILTFTNPQIADSGAYICRGSNPQGTSSATITIYVGDEVTPRPSPPEIIVQVSQEEIEAKPGELVRITCVVPNTQFRATITWTREQGELPQKSTQRDGELLIPDVRPVDSGLYTCRATDNRGGEGKATTRVNVSLGSLPVVRIEPDRQTANQGTSVQLNCIASGDPQPRIIWSKANEQFSPNVNVNGAILQIENAIITDRGMYICEAINEVGRARAASILEVERREPPVIEMYPDSRQVTERGSSAMFQCHLTGGIPTPTVEWARADGRPLTPNTVTLSGGVLRFSQVSGEEEGSYICTAVNDAGRMTATATLEIQASPVITLRPSTSPVRVREGERIQLECTADGDPTPTVSWQKLDVNYEQDIPGRSLTPSSAIYEVNSASINDQGTYQCTATNTVGSSVERIQVLVDDNLPGHTRPPVQPPPRPTPSRPTPLETESYQVPVGGDFTFRCFVEGELETPDNYIFTFERPDGGQLPRDHTVSNGLLEVRNIDRESGGEYACIVQEKITSRVLITIYARLEVVDQLSVRLEPPRQVVRPGDTVSLQCIVTGAEPITINWSKESGAMPISVTIEGGLLLFKGIATTDTGRYICTASNNAGQATSVAEVIVNERPLLTALQESMSVSLGQNIDLRCEPSGIDPSSIRWSFDRSRSLPPNARPMPSEAVLRITNAQPENAGRYKCEATTSLGGYTYDFINLNVQRYGAVDIRIRSSSDNVRLGDNVELYCDVTGQQRPVVSWSRQGTSLPYNSRVDGRSLKIFNVQPNNGGVYVCVVTTRLGVFEEAYPLAIQNVAAPEPKYGHGYRSVETRSVQFGMEVLLKCGMDLNAPVSYTWAKPGGELPIRARITDDRIVIPEVQADDAGTYVCTARNEQESVDESTLLIVTGVVPRFSGDSYLAFPTLPHAYLLFDIEISFKPESYDGLILYNSQRDGPGDFISFGLNDGYPEFRFDVGSGPAVLRSEERLALDQWHTVKLSRNRKEGTMIVNDGAPITGKSVGKFQGLDLINPFYIGGVPDISLINDQAGFSSGFQGCVSRLVIGTIIYELMRTAQSQFSVSPCDTCSDNPCKNGGFCQESYSPTGQKCICPAGHFGSTCETTGESCYPGVCGTGKCVNIPGGLECYCPFGRTGPRCSESIEIYEPSFSSGAYMAYPTPKAIKRFSVGMNVKPENMNDGIIMYCGQQEKGKGDFTSLAFRNKRLEFKFNTGTGTATLSSDELFPGEWIKVNANRTDKIGALRVNDGPMQSVEAPGTSKSLNLRTPLFIGGVDKSQIEVAPDVQVTDGFTGCISEIELMDLPVNIADSHVDSSNIGQCGASPCSRNPCLNDATCQDDSNSPYGFVCACVPGFSGPRCGSQEGGICVGDQKCFNGGVCQEVYDSENTCLCPLGYDGQNCENEYYSIESAEFNAKSWIEVDRYLLPQDGISDQVITMEFSTTEPNGLLFWLGQDPSVFGADKDFLSIGIVDGHVEFSFHMDQELVTARSENAVNDGDRHTIVARKNTNAGSLMVDDLPSVYAEGSRTLFSFNTLGNIYIGGTPDLHRMTGSKYGVGFTGCIHQLTVGSNKFDNFMDYAHEGVNVAPCRRGRVR